MPVSSREIRLVARPRGRPQESDFEVAATELPDPEEGELLIRNAYVSVDPYMRPRMNDVRSYLPPFALGKAMTGGAVGRVEASNNPQWPEGAWVVHNRGWREWAVSDGRGLLPVDAAVPVSTALGVLGMPGFTAYHGLLAIGRPEEGETVFVSAAAGAVGSTAGQIAKVRGCRVVGCAGSAEKLAWLRELGFDDAFDYHEVDPREALADGIDIYFDNVGGSLLEAAIGALRLRGRIVACGSVSLYNAERAQPGPRNMFQIVTKRLSMQGFIISDHYGQFPEFVAEMGAWIRDGTIRYRETVVEGIESAPAAFIGLLDGENIGKMLVKVGPDR